MSYCPFHGNRDTPSFTISHSTGLYLCFNPGCDESGNLIQLVKSITQRNEFEAMRFIKNRAGESTFSTNDELLRAAQPQVWTPWMPDIYKKMREDFPDSPGQDYMVNERKFTVETCEEFGVGYSAKQNMVAVPLHSPDGVIVGIVGRSIAGKEFKNSKDLPRSKTLFNLHRAKRYGDIVVVTESSFDAMRVSQAGFPNTVATLGGHISPENIAHLERYFRTIIIMTDFDNKADHVSPKCRVHGPGGCIGHNPGRELGATIASRLSTKNVLWAATDYKLVYPHGAKDAGDMTDEEIAHAIENAVSNFEYISWGVDFQ